MSIGRKDFDEKRNLIVNYLPSSFTQEDVKTLFSQIGPLSNCKLIKNKASGESLGYAFIEYPTEQLASDAIQKIDGIKVDDKIIKVSYARQSSPEIKDSNVYIAGLPSWVDEDKLLSLFSPFGTVITHKLLTGSDNQSRGVGFVRYSYKAEAQNAIDSMGGKILPDANGGLTVKLAIPPAIKQQIQHITLSSAASGKNSLRFNPLAPSNPVFLNQQSMSVSPVTSTLLPPTNQTGSSINAIVQSRQNLGGQVYSLYIYGLQPTHTELTLYELFAPFGGILNVKLIRDKEKEGKPCKGYGFVNFKKYEEAYTAVATMNGCPFEGKTLQVSFKNNPAGNNPQLTVALNQIQATHEHNYISTNSNDNYML